MNTPLLILHFELSSLSPQFKGFELLLLLKNRFASAFREANGCIGHHGSCRAGSDCVCQTVFGQQLATDPYAVRRYQKPPLPFAFRLSAEGLKASGRASAELQLAIFGDGINLLAIFVTALRRLMDRSRDSDGWQLLSLSASAADGSRTALPLDSPLEDFSSLPLLTFDELVEGGNPSPARIRLDFHSPLRLIQNGAPVRSPGFSSLAGALFRRISSIAYYYGREELQYDFKWLAEQSRQVVPLPSAVQWVNRGGSLQGLEGALTFKGNLTEFMPFIELGSRLNIGKGAAYGAGSYNLSAD